LARLFVNKSVSSLARTVIAFPAFFHFFSSFSFPAKMGAASFPFGITRMNFSAQSFAHQPVSVLTCAHKGVIFAFSAEMLTSSSRSSVTRMNFLTSLPVFLVQFESSLTRAVE